jgi:hypothetical protein
MSARGHSRGSRKEKDGIALKRFEAASVYVAIRAGELAMGLKVLGVSFFLFVLTHFPSFLATVLLTL